MAGLQWEILEMYCVSQWDWVLIPLGVLNYHRLHSHSRPL
jgi:hypothetical protein